MKKRSRKRPRRGLDRISQLPDDVLVHILSLLETKDAVRTSSLSRAWRRRRMWAHVYNLSFNFRSASQIQWRSLNETLDLLRTPNITRFSLRVQEYGRKYHNNMLLELIRFAVMRHVELLDLYLPLSLHKTTMSPFDLPLLLFSAGDSLRKLTLDRCDLFLGTRAKWGSLRVLDYGSASLLGIGDVLSGCPSLDSLTLNYVSMDDGRKVDITHNMLKKLVIRQPYCPHYIDFASAEICVAAPQLEELELLGYWRYVTCKLVDVPSLVHSCLDFFYNGESQNAEEELREKVRKIMDRGKGEHHGAHMLESTVVETGVS